MPQFGNKAALDAVLKMSSNSVVRLFNFKSILLLRRREYFEREREKIRRLFSPSYTVLLCLLVAPLKLFKRLFLVKKVAALSRRREVVRHPSYSDSPNCP